MLRDVSAQLDFDTYQTEIKRFEKYDAEAARKADEYKADLMNGFIRQPGYFKKEVHDKAWLSSELRKRIVQCKEQPFFCGRVGNTESQITGRYLEKCIGYRKRYGDLWSGWLESTSGFFSSVNDESDIDKFADLMLDSIAEADIFLCWIPKYLNILANEFCPMAELAVNDLLDYDMDTTSWVAGLAGKKVLVVSAFSKSIEYQYARKEKIAKYQGNILPDFELKTVQMLQTQCGNTCGFKTWFDAYSYMEDQCLNEDFDIAIIGGGAYGFPLSAAIKRSGRSVIEACSLTPVLFGVIGKRYIESGLLDKCGNENWIRPLEAPPTYADQIENGCYW